MQVIFQEVVLEKVVKGRNNYTIAHVTYTYNGANSTHKILSFANPEVFKTVQELRPGETIDVTVTKNDAGYNQWAAIARGGSAPAEQKAPAAAKAASGNVFQGETRDERLARQLHIVRQSALGYAIEALTPGAKTALDVDKVKALAQEFVDFVYGNDFKREVAPANTDFQDVPH